MTPDRSHDPSLRGTVDGIVQEVARAITDAKLAQLDAIAERMVAARDEVREFLKKIHSRPDAVFHIRVSTVRAKNPHITLSVRIHGVEAGQVKLTGGPERIFTPTNLKRHFGHGWEDTDATSLPWRDARVRRYLEAAAGAVASGLLGVTRELSVK